MQNSLYVKREEIVFTKPFQNDVSKRRTKTGASTNANNLSFKAIDDIPLKPGDPLDRTLSDSGLRSNPTASKKRNCVLEKLLKVTGNTNENALKLSSRNSAPLQKKYSSHHNLASTSHSALRIQPKRHYLKPGSSKSAGSEKLSTGLKASMSFTELPRKIDSASIRNNPQQFVINALKKISCEEWTDKVEGINMIIQMAETAPQALDNELHNVTVALLSECKNLRSCVSRVAIVALGRLFASLKGMMDGELEKVCLILMQKAGDVSNAFIREDATRSLNEVVRNASAGKVLKALIASGLKSKNNTIRAECAISVIHLIERMGAVNALHSKDAGKLIEILNTFAKDSHPAVRYQGKAGLQVLNQDPGELEKVTKKQLNDNAWNSIKAILDNIQKKGLESGAYDAPSTSLNRSGSARKRGGLKFNKLSDSVQQDLDEIRADLTSNKWERRLEGLRNFQKMAVVNIRAVSSDTKLVEAFIARLNDINSKVSLEAMDTYITMIYSIARYFSTETNLKAVLNQLICALMTHLPSRSEEHRRLAQDCIEESTKQIDNIALAPAIAAATKLSNIKQRPFMLKTMSGINEALYKTKPKLIEVLSLPILWESLRSPAQMNSDFEVKKAVREYAQGLSKCLGKSVLLDQATGHLSPAQKKALEALL